MIEQEEKWMCLCCRAEAEPSEEMDCCPACGERGIPASTKDRVSVSITWHELRVLVMWAERWAKHCAKEEPNMPKTVYGIAGALQLQHMDKAGLTFLNEIADLREHFGNDSVHVFDSHGKEIK